MQSDRPRQENEEFSVRLSWPKADAAPAPEEPEAEQPAPPDVAPPADRSSAKPRPGGPPLPPPPDADAPGPRPAHRAAPSAEATISPKVAKAGPSDAAPASRLSRPAPATAGASSSAAARVTEAVTAGADNTRMGRVFVEAFDRLADRLLERLRALRQDVDADLGAVRAELGSLRQAVDDVGDRVQLRQLRTTLDEVRADVAGLRRAVLEWPELEQVSSDIAAVRGDLSFIFEGMSEGGGSAQGPSELLSELQQVVANLGDEAGRVSGDTSPAALAPLVEEVAAMRSELTSIRKRMVLRSSPIDDEQLERIVSAVAERVTEELQAEGRRSRRK